MRQSPYQTHPDPPWSGFEPITLPIVAPTDRFQVAAPQAESVRSPVLGGRSSDLDQLVRSTYSRQARHGSLLASRRIPPVLDMAIPPPASGASEGGRRSPKLDPPHAKRESDVGRAAHPWRAAITRLRDLRTYRITVSATPEAHSRGKQSQPVARFSEQPSRGDCRLRLLHCADALVRHLILLLRD